MALSLLLALLTGFTIILSRTVNSHLNGKVPMKIVLLANYLTGTIGALLVFLTIGLNEPRADRALTWADLPSFSGGLMGIVVVGIGAYLVPKLPAYALTLVIFLGQLCCGIVVDLMRTGSTSGGKIVGFVLILAGLWLSIPPKSERDSFGEGGNG